jgi:hypothetical protein
VAALRATVLGPPVLGCENHIQNFTERQLFLSPLTPHLPNHDQSSVYTETYCQSDAFVLFQAGLQGSYRLDDAQPSADSSLRIVFMCLGIAKVHEEPIAKELGDMAIIALDNVGTHPLILAHHLTPVFRVELAGESSGVHEVTEHHRELSPFGVRRGRDDWRGLDLSRRDCQWGRRRHWRGGCRCAGRPTRPDEYSAVFIHCQLFGVDHVFLECFQQVVIELEAQFEDPIGQTLLPLQQIEHLCQDSIIVHYRPSTCASAAAV